jgi:hypothetical protein
MALTHSTLEQLADWCYRSEDMADIRSRARSHFFGYFDAESPDYNYIGTSGDVKSRERRFLGWFAFNFKLPDGRHPAELAANALIRPPKLSSVLSAVQKARYVTGVATGVIKGQSFHMELEDEQFTINSPVLSHILRREQTVSAHILPATRNRWLIGPGWVTWPMTLGPGMRSSLKTAFQPDPIAVERFLQGRVQTPEDLRSVEYPRDATLESAVVRMSEIAKKEDKPKLIMSPEEWKSIVLSHMSSNNATGFAKEICRRVGKISSVAEANKWLALAMNIWNTTPQPDRGGKSANELFRQQWGNGERFFPQDKR